MNILSLSIFSHLKLFKLLHKACYKLKVTHSFSCRCNIAFVLLSDNIFKIIIIFFPHVSLIIKDAVFIVSSRFLDSPPPPFKLLPPIKILVISHTSSKRLACARAIDQNKTKGWTRTRKMWRSRHRKHRWWMSGLSQ